MNWAKSKVLLPWAIRSSKKLNCFRCNTFLIKLDCLTWKSADVLVANKKDKSLSIFLLVKAV